MGLIRYAPGWTRQPQEVVNLAPEYAGNSLDVFAHIGPQISGTETVVSGAKVLATRMGLAYGIGATFGSTNSDVVTLRSGRAPLLRTFVFQAIFAGAGPSGSGRVVDGREVIFYSGSLLKLNRLFIFIGGSSVGQWAVSLNSSSSLVRTVVITHDGSSPSNVPKFWIDGSSLSVTTEATPTGSLNTTTTATYYLGNRAAADRAFNGVIGPVIALDRILPDSQARDVASGDVWSLFEPRRIWVPSASVAPSMPTLSLPTVTAIGATQATPRVTLTY